MENNEVKEPVKTEEPTDIAEPKKEEPKQEEPKKEPKKEEPKEESKQEEVQDQKIAELETVKKELEEANRKVAEIEGLNTTIETLRNEASQKDTVIKEYEDLINKMVETKMEQVPEDYKDLIPDNLDLKGKLSWLEKAEAKGLFTKEEKKKPNVEIGKPLNVDVPAVDTAKLSGGQLLRMAYNTIKK